MASLTAEAMSKLSRTELHKRKLAEYLALKGRLKPPNPKPYLKEGTAVKKNVRASQISRLAGEGKENHVPSAMTNTFTKNRNSTASKLELRTTSMVPSAISKPQHLTFKPNVRQTTRQSSTTHASGAAFVSNGPPRQTKAPPHRCDVKKPSLKSSLKAHGNDAMTDFSRKEKTREQHKTASMSLTTCSTTTNTVQKKTEAKTETGKRTVIKRNCVIKTSATHPGVTCDQDNRYSGSVQFNERLTSKSQAKSARTLFAQNESVFQGKQLNRTGHICEVGHEPRPTSQIARSSTKINSTLSSLSSKATKVARSTSVGAASVNKGVSQQQRAPVQRSTNPTVKAPVQRSTNPTVKAPVQRSTNPTVKAPHTASSNSKSSSQARGTGQPKTPKSGFNPGIQGVRTVPLDGKKKVTAAQEERMRKLQEWREARGVTYKRPPMPVQPVKKKKTSAPPQNYWTTMEQEDDVHGFVCAVDQSLNDCIKLIQQGCHGDQVRDVLSRVPMAQKFAKYWICQVRLMEREGNLDVLPTFEEAIRIVREPLEELRSVVFEILKRKEAKGSSFSRTNEVEVDSKETEEPPYGTCTPTPVAVQIHGKKRESSVIKYKITATPSGKRDQQKVKPGQVSGHEIRFFTPVRRSLRIERTASRFPAALQEHDPCVTSLKDLLSLGEGEGEGTRETEPRDSPLYVYRENGALKEDVHVRLVYDEAVA